MGLRKSYTVSSVTAPSGLTMLNYDGILETVAAAGTIYLDSDIGDAMSYFLTENTTWKTLTGTSTTGDVTLTNKTIKGIANAEYTIKINTAVSGNMDVATSTLTVKTYSSADVLLETRTIYLPTLSSTNRDDYVNLSTLVGASYVVIGGVLKNATGDYTATITVSFEALDEVPSGCKFVIGTEGGNVINLGIQLIASDGSDLVGRGLIDFYISDDMYGNTCATAADSLAIGTDGVIIGNDATLNSCRILSESDGDIDINITEAGGAATYFGVVILPDGKKIVSDKIIFAA